MTTNTATFTFRGYSPAMDQIAVEKNEVFEDGTGRAVPPASSFSSR